MECVATTDRMRGLVMARAMMVLDNYEWLRQQAAAVHASIIPLKGIDLLLSLYSSTLDREVSDIDIYCHGDERCLALAHRLCENGYHPEFEFTLDPVTMAAKRKVSLISDNPLRVNIDIHTAFVTKKFFSQSTGSFNADAYRRCVSGSMDPLDRWLFLAQHAAFHNYSNPKWVRDLVLLLEDMDETMRRNLSDRAAEYGFRRVLLATLQAMADDCEAARRDLESQDLAAGEIGFLNYIARYRRPMRRTLHDRLVAPYLEFSFIDNASQRKNAWRRLFLPDAGTLTNIYRVRHKALLGLYYPLNIMVVGASAAVFGMDYLTGKKR